MNNKSSVAETIWAFLKLYVMRTNGMSAEDAEEYLMRLSWRDLEGVLHSALQEIRVTKVG